ncbi:NBR1-Ig-like domain-containing protein [Actinomadura rupiterrae]|uniref:NBR1-Ig-like domain-containing protein n=1 Tax=Actinomadura rupiterrae TaxID=559627 RepID=UPI0020A58F6F|nr:NBR1-Ig-like domain-containing protein [Actinomadura rupiterrae]MCP2337983.1 hypothetical protein [Actinomadura rupiterrae]
MDDKRARAEAVADFASALRELRASVGNPSFREMSGRSGAISHTTLYEATKGNRLPSWGTTAEFVKACGADPDDYRERWEKANLTVRTAGAGGRPETPAEPPAETPAANQAATSARRPAGVPAGLGPSTQALVGEPSASVPLPPTPPDEATATPAAAAASTPSAPPRTSADSGPSDAPSTSDQPWTSGPSGPSGTSGTPGTSGQPRTSVGTLPEPIAEPAFAPTYPHEPGQQVIAVGVPVALPAPEPKGRFRRHRTLIAFGLVGVATVGTSVVLSIVFTQHQSASNNHAPVPSGTPSAAAAGAAYVCPVRPPHPPLAPPLHKGDAATFIADMTLADCTHVGPGQTIAKIWRLKNAGTVPWKGYSLQRLDGPQKADQCRTRTRVPIKDTGPGQMVDIRTDITTPKQAGFCYVRFKMLDASGKVAFPGSRPVNFQVIVNAP